MQFETKIIQIGNNTGIEVSAEMLDELGGGRKPLVVVTLNNYSYRCGVGKIGGRFMISLSAENRKKANVKGGDTLEINIKLDTEPRTVEVPADLLKAFVANKIAKVNFEKLAPSKKKAIALSITDAKSNETRIRRIEKAIASLK
ncbi:MAG: YdeI/OmpD-associated family protein [Ginsengibacter sp.]